MSAVGTLGLQEQNCAWLKFEGQKVRTYLPRIPKDRHYLKAISGILLTFVGVEF